MVSDVIDAAFATSLFEPTDARKSGHKLQPPFKVVHTLTEDGRVGEIEWRSNYSHCKAVLNDDDVSYTFTVINAGDNDFITRMGGLSLADCVLQAATWTHLIPLQTFDLIECNNRHR